MKAYEIIEDKIIAAADAYYNGNDLLMTDIQFDTLVDELKEKRPDSPILKRIGWGFKPTGKKASHMGEEVGSLNKLKHGKDDVPQDNLIATPKLDGLSIVCYFQSDELVMALTRGDGKTGVVCTDKMNKILGDDIPFHLHSGGKDQFVVRGEVVHKLDGRAPGELRNIASGIMNRDVINEDINNLTFVAYQIRWDNTKAYSKKLTMLNELSTLGFTTVPSYGLFLGTPDILERLYNKWKQEYPVDGLVLTHADSIKLEESFTEDSIAYKFASDEADAIVGYVEWNTGSTGRIVPRIILSAPVALSGANFNHIAGHNYGYVKRNSIGKGSLISFTRSGEVIPYITGVKNTGDFDSPGTCPTCGSLDLSITISGETKEEVDLMCGNPNCSAKKMNGVYRLIEIVGSPDGLGDVAINKWLEELNIKSVKDLLKADTLFMKTIYEQDQVTEHYKKIFGNHYGNLLYKLAQDIRARHAIGYTLQEFWYMLGIPALGKSSSKKLAMIIPLDTGLREIEDLPVASHTKESLRENLAYWTELLGFIPLIYPGKDVEIKEMIPVAMTGTISVPRKEFEKILESKGYKLGSVSKKTKYLITPGPSDSNKYNDAISLKTPIVTEAEFMEIING